eukprot:TRINITY_DN12189_c0_g2_i1.p1 TRINITY_DN12189_c0_g2~~TRINITY_DN12189_c0_g2_i1.p1  ORF type:complete len:508 (+),score=125.60 TRINITY_DN12189_c0_g2_i1:56-1579(+)
MSYIGAIDQGTSSTRFILFDKQAQVVASHQVEFPQYTPHPGWVEHNPEEIMDSVHTCIEHVMRNFQPSDVVAIGVTNQRETTVVWDKITGKPLHHALVWLDTRTHHICETVVAETGNRQAFQSKTGLPISTYFSAFKLKWLLEHVPAVREAAEQDRLMFGTIETWIIWNLTGGKQDGVHVTDVTNASRTCLMNLRTRDWDEEICQKLSIPMGVLPPIKSNSEVYGTVKQGALANVPISGALGDQQAALVGQLCFQSGDAKNTYGTGCFMLLNTGEQPVFSSHGLLTTVGFQFGQSPVHFALEGSVAIAGAAIKWLRDNLQIIQTASEVETLAMEAKDNGGVYFVPAFAGLFAPYWREDARGTIVGLTQYSTKAHIARAVLEATCFQTYDVLQAMNTDCNSQLRRLKVDGGMTVCRTLLQIQADVLQLEVARPAVSESTALGAAIAAGLALGFWSSLDDVVHHVGQNFTVYRPSLNGAARQKMLKNWKKAIQKAMCWVEEEDDEEFEE